MTASEGLKALENILEDDLLEAGAGRLGPALHPAARQMCRWGATSIMGTHVGIVVLAVEARDMGIRMVVWRGSCVSTGSSERAPRARGGGPGARRARRRPAPRPLPRPAARTSRSAMAADRLMPLTAAALRGPGARRDRRDARRPGEDGVRRPGIAQRCNACACPRARATSLRFGGPRAEG